MVLGFNNLAATDRRVFAKFISASRDRPTENLFVVASGPLGALLVWCHKSPTETSLSVTWTPTSDWIRD